MATAPDEHARFLFRPSYHPAGHRTQHNEQGMVSMATRDMRKSRRVRCWRKEDFAPGALMTASVSFIHRVGLTHLPFPPSPGSSSDWSGHDTSPPEGNHAHGDEGRGLTSDVRFPLSAEGPGDAATADGRDSLCTIRYSTTLSPIRKQPDSESSRVIRVLNLSSAPPLPVSEALFFFLSFYTLRMIGSPLRARLVDIEQQIQALEAQIDALRAERARVEKDLQAIVYPVLTLPPEILLEMFVHYVDDHRSRSPLHLIQICRFWRQVALSTCRL
ncbi:hypothetical protein FB45DRAFT_297430 [Roridomyces roridus]|uniref:F-box domain-containing protein n=1 Tax=Roridomyces roridus TaxID=1738132 RepID=A0AAD7CCC0_9AGAR|nr:hypothetical protein FB45DRAFT_297430 [Roridomyces roridus]